MLCTHCHQEFDGDPDWDDWCPNCDLAWRQEEDRREEAEALPDDDGPCDCQSCRGYPDNFLG